jgi:hypothetical protein
MGPGSRLRKYQRSRVLYYRHLGSEEVIGPCAGAHSRIGDMPCGLDAIPPPAVMPPTFRAPASAFFDAQGRPRFAVKYTKGC